MFRDPVAHFRSQLAVYKSALTFDGRDTYLFGMVGRWSSTKQKHMHKQVQKNWRWSIAIITLACFVFLYQTDLASIWFEKLSTCKRTACIVSMAVSTCCLLVLSVSGSEVHQVMDQWGFGTFNAAYAGESEAVIHELHEEFGKLFNNPQARFLLGFPYCLPGKAVPAPDDEVDGDPWVNFQKTVADHQMRALIVAAVDDLFFAGITEEWDKSVLLLRNITGWDIQGYTKMLHNTDSGHPSAPKRAPLTDSDARSIRVLNRWDEFVFKVATARLHRRSVRITNTQATCQTSEQIPESTDPLKRIQVHCKFSTTS